MAPPGASLRPGVQSGRPWRPILRGRPYGPPCGRAIAGSPSRVTFEAARYSHSKPFRRGFQGQGRDVGPGVSQRQQRLTAGHRDGIGKPKIPGHDATPRTQFRFLARDQPRRASDFPLWVDAPQRKALLAPPRRQYLVTASPQLDLVRLRRASGNERRGLAHASFNASCRSRPACRVTKLSMLEGTSS